MKIVVFLLVFLIGSAICFGYLALWLEIIDEFQRHGLLALGLIVFVVFHAVLLWRLPRDKNVGPSQREVPIIPFLLIFLVGIAICFGYLALWLEITDEFQRHGLLALGLIVFVVFHAVLLWRLPRVKNAGPNQHDDDD